MRLFLSSYRAGKYPDKLVELFGKGAKVAVITNAKDYKMVEDRQTKVEENLDYFKSLDLKPKEIDLRPYFHKPGAERLLAKYNCIWLAGGNVFLLRRALSYSGIDKYLYDAVRKNEVILAGDSAGAIVMGPTLRYSEMEAPGHEDSPTFAVESYQKEILWDGLDFINYVPVPHYKSGDYASEIEKYIKRLNKAGLVHKEMTDDQAIIINNEVEEFLS